VIQVLLLYPNGVRQDIVLAGVPRVGEQIRLRLNNGSPSTPSMVVTHVLWIEGEGRAPEPEVIVSVAPTVNSAKG
jgi:hypothetical protein